MSEQLEDRLTGLDARIDAVIINLGGFLQARGIFPYAVTLEQMCDAVCKYASSLEDDGNINHWLPKPAVKKIK